MHCRIARPTHRQAGAGCPVIPIAMPSPTFHTDVRSVVAGRHERGGLRCTARTDCAGRCHAPGQRFARPPGRPGLINPHPATGGAGARWTGNDSAQKMASTSAISAATSEAETSKSQASPMSGATSTAAHSTWLIITGPCPPGSANQALMTWWPLRPPIEILRGLARSATGIRNRSTPPS